MAVEAVSRASGAPATPRRVLPHNLEIEASILGGVIVRNELLADLQDLDIDDFYDHRHKVVFRAIRSLAAADKPIDVVTIENEIERVDREFDTDKLETIGGIAFLGELTLRVPTVDNVLTYRDEVRLHSRHRQAIQELSSALERAWTWPHDPGDLISETSARLQRLDHLSVPAASRVKLIDVGRALEELESLAKAPIYPTPFPTLNDAIGFGGLLGTQVYTLAAGTGRGKTSFVAEVAAFAAQTVPVLVATYEMRPGYFVARRAAGVLGIHSNDILRGNCNMSLVMRSMPYTKLFLLHKPSLADLRIAVDRLAQKFGTPPLVIVDYLQKLADEISRRQHRPDLRLATSEASETLCDIADRTSCAIMSVSAIGRGNNKRAATPRKLEPYELVDVAKESGNVEYDGAGLIVLSLDKETEGDERIATITLAKARFGRELHIEARYHGRRGSWRDLGEVEVDDAPSESTDQVRRKIALTLVKAPQKSATQLQRAAGLNRMIALAEIKLMIQAGEVVRRDGFLQLSESGQQLISGVQ